jgi:phosphoribosylformimino-5-aminoimidazole carboxamide ribotide isomerase
VKALLYPAIDLRDGKVVRLTQGDYTQEKIYGEDPVQVASDFATAGAKWIHVVDLDAARGGGPVNRSVIGDIVKAVGESVRVQTGGGVRTQDDAQELRDHGVARVVMGSAAVKNPQLVEKVADIVDVAVGLDHRGGMIAVEGWTQSSDLTLVDALAMYPAAKAFVITDIARDGMLSGPDLEGLAAAVAQTSIPVIASGGVSSIQDIVDLAQISGLGGVITGRAIYEGRFSVAEALRALA